MILTNKQEQGLKLAIERFKAGEKYTVISGYAGSGKSTLVRFIVDALPISEEYICFCAFTGKAAEVLRKKGNKNVCTLHKLLYDHYPLRTGGFYRKPKIFLDYKIVVVDEVSMAPKTLMDLLFSHNVYVICLGDPGQLPPIDKDEDNHLLDHPHIFLDEIMRQAQESEIIRLTMQIREQKPLQIFNGKEVKIISAKDLNTGVLNWGDQILVATNLNRCKINQQMRQLQGRDGDPVDGDKMICLRNYWEELSNDENSLVNGTIGYLKNSFKTWRRLPPFLGLPMNSFDILTGSVVVPETKEEYQCLEMDYKMITTGEKCCDWKTSFKLNKLRGKYGELVPKEFAFAYAITTHKAQGSEWDKVVVLEEKFPFAKEEHTKWLYTACTRASKQLVLVR